MNWMILKRMLVAGGKNFARGGAVSAATVLIMTVTLAIIASLIFLSALLTFTLNTITDKVDVSVYFVTTASEADILSVQSQLDLHVRRRRAYGFHRAACKRPTHAPGAPGARRKSARRLA